LEQKIVKTCRYAALIFALIIGVFTLASSNSLVSAQPCTAQLGSPSMSVEAYYVSNFEVTLPVSTACSFYTGPVYAAGTAYDTTYNSNVGTANAVLSANYGGYVFNGQLVFNLPASVQSHSVQFSVSIYSTQTAYAQGYYGAPYYGGTLLATASETFALEPSVYQNGYPYYPTYPSYSYPTYPSYSYYYPGNYYYSTPYYSGGYYYSNNYNNYNNGYHYYNSWGYHYYGGSYYHNDNDYCSTHTCTSHHHH